MENAIHGLIGRIKTVERENWSPKVKCNGMKEKNIAIEAVDMKYKKLKVKKGNLEGLRKTGKLQPD